MDLLLDFDPLLGDDMEVDEFKEEIENEDSSFSDIDDDDFDY